MANIGDLHFVHDVSGARLRQPLHRYGMNSSRRCMRINSKPVLIPSQLVFARRGMVLLTNDLKMTRVRPLYGFYRLYRRPDNEFHS